MRRCATKRAAGAVLELLRESSNAIASTSSRVCHHKGISNVRTLSKTSSSSSRAVKKEGGKRAGDGRSHQRGIAGARKDDASSASRKRVVAKINGSPLVSASSKGSATLDVARRGNAAMPQAATASKISTRSLKT